MMALKEQLSTTAEKHIAKMQEWLESHDPILVAEAQQFFTTQNQTIQNQNEWVTLAQPDEVEPEQSSGCLSEGTPMQVDLE